ncbi:hypothetical protein BGZ57DRAFT_965340 [Hyaloscypha finlandica]|nr:hypothetical protein BGZ57DRAFT_965340 [Hyaloscypha finlandica]
MGQSFSLFSSETFTEDPMSFLGFEMSQTAAPAPSLNAAAIPSSTLESRSPITFICFPKLPPELQRKIWKLAVQPKIITLDVGDVYQQGPNVRPKTDLSPHPILSVCSISREVALGIYGGKPYSFVTGCSCGDEENHETWFRHFDLYINPAADTFYFSEHRHLDIFARFWQIRRGDSLERHVVVRSLVVDNVKAKALDTYDLARWQNADMLWINRDIHILGTMAMLTAPFVELEEFILVGFEVVDTAAAQQMRVAMGTTRISEEENIDVFVECLQWKLQIYPMEVECEVAQGPRGCTWSKWWEDPKLTLMTKEEFKAQSR